MDISLAGFVQYLYLFSIFALVRARPLNEDGLILMPSETSIEETENFGTRWAVLVAGSSGYWNYRHQADVCHAYQILKKGGLKDENIVVFMYDDIAYNKQNPHPGVIINRPGGQDVYAGVPKDYTGKDVNVDNLLAVILGNKTAVRGGSGKVVDSGPDDHVFVYYTDHGGPGVLGMPAYGYLYADDFINALKQKHAARAYKEMVIYVEACESGSIFEGMLDDEMEIYVTTAANAEESSWGTYCPDMDPPPPPEYDTCLGDLYSVAWMEDSEIHNMRLETLNEQYVKVKDRTSNNNTYVSGSHVMKYGDARVESEEAYIYIGSDPANENVNVGSPSHNNNNENKVLPLGLQYLVEGKKAKGLNQRDADLVYFWRKYQSANEGGEKIEAWHKFMKEMGKRTRLDGNIEELGKILFGKEKGVSILKAVRPYGQPLVDDWTCLRAMVGIYERQCGGLGQYGMKHMRAFANMCNARIDIERMETASSNACASNIIYMY